MNTFLRVLKGFRLDQNLISYLRLNGRVLNLKTKKAQIVSISILTVFIVSQVIMPYKGSFASGPRFNFLPGDYETLLLANATKGETIWHDPVNADYNDRISFNIYYHNGMEDTVAHNTRVRVSLPSTPSTHLVSTAYLWADNADLVTDTGTVNVNGQVSAQLEYIAGSSMWYANQGSTPKPDPVHLPDGITQDGVNIGDITGCWEFTGFVVFQAKVVKIGQPQLDITKLVRNVTAEETTFVDHNYGQPNDTLQYKIVISNPGNDTAQNVSFKDFPSSKISFVSNSLNINGQTSSQNIFSSYLNLGDLDPSDALTIIFDVKIASASFPVGTTNIVNTAKTYADEINIREDHASTCVIITAPDLAITKYVKNITKPDHDYLKEGTAWPKDILEYKINFSNPGSSTALDVKIKDILPNYLTYISGSTFLYESENQGLQLPDQITTEGVSIGDIQPDDHGYILFRVKVDACPPAGTHRLVNLAKIWASNVSEKHDTAVTILTVTPPPPPVLTIDKKVANITRGETTFVDANTAYAGDILQYRITFENVGKSLATNVIIKDELPGSVTFLSGSAMAYVYAGSIALSDAVVEKGVNLPNLAAGDNGYFTLKVKVKNNVQHGLKLVDTAHIFADGNIHEYDSATTVIKKPIRIVIETEHFVSTGTPILAIVMISTVITLAIIFGLQRKRLTKLSRETIRQARIAR
jgi:uncharacterized repeat protein (TIGR01451 family)